MQLAHPIAFFSRKLGPILHVASTYTKELYVITEAIRKWRQYLLGRFFIVRTDHKSIRELFQQTIQTPKQLCWQIVKLQFPNLVTFWKLKSGCWCIIKITRARYGAHISVDSSQRCKYSDFRVA